MIKSKTQSFVMAASLEQQAARGGRAATLMPLQTTTIDLEKLHPGITEKARELGSWILAILAMEHKKNKEGLRQWI